MIKTFFLLSAVIALVVMIHYEFLFRFTVIMPVLRVKHRFRIVLGVLAALVAHSIEVWVFAIIFYIMHHADGWGSFGGNFDGSLAACVYFSFASYTTLGLGDIEPFGEIRFVTGLESLTGLVLITWTASFLYLEMTQYWNRK